MKGSSLSVPNGLSGEIPENAEKENKTENATASFHRYHMNIGDQKENQKRSEVKLGSTVRAKRAIKSTADPSRDKILTRHVTSEA